MTPDLLKEECAWNDKFLLNFKDTAFDRGQELFVGDDVDLGLDLGRAWRHSTASWDERGGVQGSLDSHQFLFFGGEKGVFGDNLTAGIALGFASVVADRHGTIS